MAKKQNHFCKENKAETFDDHITGQAEEVRPIRKKFVK
jgi:hypothetical protein